MYICFNETKLNDMKKLITIIITLLFFNTVDAQKDLGHYSNYSDYDVKILLSKTWDLTEYGKKFDKRETFLAKEYISQRRDTISAYTIGEHEFDDSGRILTYSDELVDFKEVYTSADVYRTGETGSRWYHVVFTFGENSKYDAVVVITDQVITKDNLIINYMSTIAFVEGKHYKAHNVIDVNY